MRSTVITIIVTLLLVAAFGVFTWLSTDSLTRDYLGMIDSIIEMIQAEDYEKAGQTADELDEKWQKVCMSLQVIAFHQDTNQADSYIHMLKAGISAKNQGISLWALYDLADCFKNILQREVISLTNIF